MDERIEVLGIWKRRNRGGRRPRRPEELSSCEQAQLEQERMARGRQQDQGEEDEEVIVVAVGSSAAVESSSATESSSVPRKRVRTGKGDGGVEAYIKAISSALG